MNRAAALAACEQIVAHCARADAVYAQLLADMEESRLAGEALLAKWREQDRQAEVRRVGLHSIDAVTVAVLGVVS